MEADERYAKTTLVLPAALSSFHWTEGLRGDVARLSPLDWNRGVVITDLRCGPGGGDRRVPSGSRAGRGARCGDWSRGVRDP
jgi:hypothetical protein